MDFDYKDKPITNQPKTDENDDQIIIDDIENDIEGF